MIENTKCNICLIGSGGVGTIAAVVLEKSGQAKVTAVLRSRYEIVKENGWDIDSVDHGILRGWRPSRGTLNSVISTLLLETDRSSCEHSP